MCSALTHHLSSTPPQSHNSTTFHVKHKETDGMSETEFVKCNLPFERVPTCACDKGIDDPPTPLHRLECKMRGGPCREDPSREDFCSSSELDI